LQAACINEAGGLIRGGAVRSWISQQGENAHGELTFHHANCKILVMRANITATCLKIILEVERISKEVVVLIVGLFVSYLNPVKQINQPRRYIIRCDCEHGTDEDGPTSAPDKRRHGRHESARSHEDALVLVLPAATLHRHGEGIGSRAVVSVRALGLIATKGKKRVFHRCGLLLVLHFVSAQLKVRLYRAETTPIFNWCK
jgi:hypothetical protein